MPIVLISGANRGIGLEFARQYAADGWQVIATSRNPDAAGALHNIPGVEVRHLDSGDPASIDGFARFMAGRPVDLLINNAGIMGPDFPHQSKDGIDVAGWTRTMQVNVLGPLLLTLALRDNIARGDQRKVVTLSSQLGSIAENQSGGMYAYRVSKAGINMGNRSLAVDLRDQGFICVVLHPGWVQTDMGGQNAPLDVVTSVSGLRRVIDGLTLEQSGRFFAHDGREIPW